MKIDSMGYYATVMEAARAAAERRGAWLRRLLGARHAGRCVPVLRAAAQRTDSLIIGTGNRGRVRAQPDDGRHAGQRPTGALGRALHARSRLADQAPHREALLDDLVASRAPHARVHPRDPRDLGAWETGEKLDFRGDFYAHTLMTPFFNPGPNPHGNPKIILAAVGPLMTEAAGEVADGIFCHAFSTERYLREATLPALQRGADKAGPLARGASRSSRPGSSSRATARRSARRAPSSCAARLVSTARRPRTGRCSSSTAGATSRTS